MSVSINTPSGRTMLPPQQLCLPQPRVKIQQQAPAHRTGSRISSVQGPRKSRYRPSQGALKAIKRQIVPVDAFGNRKPRLRGWLHVVLCGIDYSNIFLIIAGAVCFALRKPNPVPGWFEFHEVFHLGTVIGYACHVVAIYLIACAL